MIYLSFNLAKYTSNLWLNLPPKAKKGARNEADSPQKVWQQMSNEALLVWNYTNKKIKTPCPKARKKLNLLLKKSDFFLVFGHWVVKINVSRSPQNVSQNSSRFARPLDGAQMASLMKPKAPQELKMARFVGYFSSVKFCEIYLNTWVCSVLQSSGFYGLICGSYQVTYLLSEDSTMQTINQRQKKRKLSGEQIFMRTNFLN